MDGGVRSEIKHATLTDDEVVRRVLGGDIALLEIIMRRYNQRLFRVVRSILKDDSQAEDIVQEAYVRAYEHLSQFEGRAKFSTWLTRELLQRELYSAAGAPARTAFQFLGARCDQVVARVMARIQGSDSGSSAGRKFSRD